MGYNTESTKWPSSTTLSPEVKALIENLFRTLDDSGPGAGDRLADEIFAVTGSIRGPHNFDGKEEIRHSRAKAWNVITKRRHEILQVYVANAGDGDLMLRGTIGCELKNGKQLKSGFGAWLVVDEVSGPSPRVQSYEPFVDTAPVLEALKEL